MEKIRKLISRLVGKPFGSSPMDAEGLRTAFQDRYHHFKLLLNANNRALDLMTEMEEALRGISPFGMAFVSSRCTGVSTSVWQIVDHLIHLAPTHPEYELLRERFREIQKKINPYIRKQSLPGDGPLVVPLSSVHKDMADVTGGKMANLGELVNNLHLEGPDGFVVTAFGYQRFMAYNDLQTEIDRRIQSSRLDRREELLTLSAGIQQLIIGSRMPPELERAIREAYSQMKAREGSDIPVAVRSSALGEDIQGAAFAGQYRSELNVNRDHLLEAYRDIVASKYGVPAMAYRFNRGLRDEDIAMCVGCLSMVDSVAGGVAYSRNPVDMRDDRISISSVWGLPKTVVDGSGPSDLFVVERGAPPVITHRDIQAKTTKVLPRSGEGIRRVSLSEEEAAAPSLSDDQILALSEIVMKIEDHYGVPQDVEWAVSPDGTLVILQCRPLERSGVGRLPARDKGGELEGGVVLLSGGITASPGAGAGTVYPIRREMDTLGFPDGAVLIAAQALPRWAALLDRASAVVAESGTVAGHLANVAREFKVPALFGLPGALDHLKQGQVITVDADRGLVFEGLREDLLQTAAKAHSLMEGSPVFEALKGAASHIIPLHLLDPDSPAFKAASCTTFHDITRFCHEKSVQEMFRFGKDHRFPERSSKQLMGDVPMQWWVLNLDDGFAREIEGKYVRIEDIVSIPMRAVWEGITAKPWQGPPPLDGRGFMSVMFQATTNTALVPGVKSRYATRNYFMISRHYCTLNSRFGFHFSLLEALVSERAGENYISFQFKGGAADLSRRQKRISFIGEILEHFGFRVELREDNLFSRLEDREQAFMENRLKILGYLIIHTRQLDMIMANPRAVGHYFDNILEDVRSLFPLDESTLQAPLNIEH